MASFPIHSGQTFLLIGDSITDCGRRNEKTPYGDGYLSLLRELAIARHPALEIRWLNRGIGGNTVIDLRDRWEDDCIREKPDWLSIKIGINDLHLTLRKAERAADPQRFKTAYRSLLERVRSATQAELVLIDPFYLSADRESDGFRRDVLKLLPEYLAVVEELAGAFGARHLKTQAVFEEQMRYRAPQDFAPEPVHPYRIGHSIIANALYDLLCAAK